MLTIVHHVVVLGALEYGLIFVECVNQWIFTGETIHHAIFVVQEVWHHLYIWIENFFVFHHSHYGITQACGCDKRKEYAWVWDPNWQLVWQQVSYQPKIQAPAHLFCWWVQGDHGYRRAEHLHILWPYPQNPLVQMGHLWNIERI